MTYKTANAPALDRFIRSAREAGVGQAQLVNFVRANYIPQPRQAQVHAAARLADRPGGPTRIVAGGTRGQAKSHAILAQVGLDDCQRWPGLKVLYLRKVQKSAGEQFEDLIRKLFSGIEHTYTPSAHELSFPNGSFIIFGGFRSDGEIAKYIGIEYDVIIIEDATQLPRTTYDAIGGSLRTARMDGYRPRLYLSANPGGIGHNWFKALFFDPYVRKRESDSRFIHFKLGDNIFINPEYREYLDRLSGWLRRAWRDGDFSIAAGAYFTSFDLDRHVVDVIPNVHWRFWLAKDYGHVHWNVTGLFGQDPPGRKYLLDYTANRRTRISDDASDIARMLGDNGVMHSQLTGLFAGSDIFARRADERRHETSVADIYAEHGLDWTPANMDRVGGFMNLRDMFDSDDLFIASNCDRVIDDLPQMLHDPNRGEDMLKVDCDPETGEGGDDFVDMLRYGTATAIAGESVKYQSNLPYN